MLSYGGGVRDRLLGGRIIDNRECIVGRPIVVGVHGSYPMLLVHLTDVRILDPLGLIGYLLDVQSKAKDMS